VAELGAVPVTDEYANSRLASHIPDDPRERIKLFIVHPTDVAATIDHLGGSWKESGPPLTPPRIAFQLAGLGRNGARVPLCNL